MWLVLCVKIIDAPHQIQIKTYLIENALEHSASDAKSLSSVSR